MATTSHARVATAGVGAPTSGTGINTVHTTAGEKEDFSDIIGLIAPYDTPCYSTFRKVDAIAPVVHWQEDELAAPSATAIVEGADVGDDADVSSPGISINYTQLFEKTAKVSSTADATQWHGRSSEIDYQVMKRGREIKRNIEFAMVGVTNVAVPGDLTTAREMASADQLITPTKALAITTNLVESDVLTVQQEVYEAGGDPNWLLVTPATSAVVANFAYIDPTNGSVASARSREIENGNKLVNIVEIYQSPYGTMTVVTDKFLMGAVGAGGDGTGSTALLLETDRWAIPVLQPIQVEDLAKVGHSDRKLVSCESSLLHENTNASGSITNIDTNV